jgi:hypothetical protein
VQHHKLTCPSRPIQSVRESVRITVLCELVLLLYTVTAVLHVNSEQTTYQYVNSSFTHAKEVVYTTSANAINLIQSYDDKLTQYQIAANTCSTMHMVG